MSKNIVILLDGTSNEIATKRTNILRLYGCLRKNEKQLVYYDPGVGTFGAENAWSQLVQKGSEVWGMATGWGLDQNVKEAYRFIVDNYDDGKSSGGERDRLYIFGFSRGAYSARVLAGFICAIGLLERRNINLLDYAYRAYKRIGEQKAEDGFAEVRLYERILATDRPPIRLLGLFDTVASVIEPGPEVLPRVRTHAYTKHNKSVECVRHAVALDERRRMYRALAWPEEQPYQPSLFAPETESAQDSREVWFTGVHSDIGGGYAENEGGLAKIPLHWMIEETKATGLEYVTATVNRIVLGKDKDNRYSPPDAFAAPHNSMTRGWNVFEHVPLPAAADSKRPVRFGLSISRSERRYIPQGARIHASAMARVDQDDILAADLPSDHLVEGDIADWAT